MFPPFIELIALHSPLTLYLEVFNNSQNGKMNKLTGGFDIFQMFSLRKRLNLFSRKIIHSTVNQAILFLDCIGQPFREASWARKLCAGLRPSHWVVLKVLKKLPVYVKEYQWSQHKLESFKTCYNMCQSVPNNSRYAKLYKSGRNSNEKDTRFFFILSVEIMWFYWVFKS